MPTPLPAPRLAVIGGSGIYDLADLQNVTTHDLETPFGKPSAPVVVGELDGSPVAFLARHGLGHHISPSEINYRANLYALKMLGVTHVLGINACGSLREDYAPGDIVIPDQLFDFTRSRPRTFFGEGCVVHIGSAEPFCERFSAQVAEAVITTGATVHRGGAFIVIEGPRFSTKAESNAFRGWGMSIIGMTAAPEAFLAREAELCYAALAHVTDYDVWHVNEAPVTVEMILTVLRNNTQTAQLALRHLAPTLAAERACACPSALANAIITCPDCIPPATRTKLALLIEKYVK
jgi:5'-methylthioadenosine phosphorylase